MKKLSSAIFASVLLVAPVVMTGCSIDKNVYQNNDNGIEPSKTMVTNDLTVAEFNQLQASSAIKVVYQQSTDRTYSATLTAPENLIPYFIYTQNGNTLNFRLKEVSINGNPNITVTVTSPELTNVNLSGACDFDSNSINQSETPLALIASGASDITINNLTVKDVNAQISGASELEINAVNANDVTIDVSGASDAVIGGTAQTVTLNASGASGIKAGKLQAAAGSVIASGASDIKANIKNVTMQSSTGSSTIKL
ncbi:MAG: DUF2807 domain-containing protein [Muribaculaceae bacterium]|nr:DUF2807 domain-containing protein [Muribaculaceae bacterium]